MTRPRVAWFSPLAPIRSGISAYSAELLPLLARDYEIEVFLDMSPETSPREPSETNPACLPAHEFIVRHTLAPYDLVVYQLGNAACHDYMWPYLVRYPGLVVLHDAALHHARAHALLSSGRTGDYRTEFSYSHPAANAALAEFAVAGLSGSPYYLWPHVRIPIESARVVAVHSASLARALAEEYPDASLRVIRMGVPEVGASPARGEPPVFACYGRVTPEKRIEQVLRAFAVVVGSVPDARLCLVGDLAQYYDVRADVSRFGLAAHVQVIGYVPDEALDRWLMAADVCVCLRWPTAGETSASWLRCLAAGKPTVITDLMQTADVPVLDPRSWTVAPLSDGLGPGHRRLEARDAVAIAIDVLDEDHSLGLALVRLASDSWLREQLGRNARAWWAAGHTLEHMASDYREAMTDAMNRRSPARSQTWPAHLRDDGTRLAHTIAADIGVQIADF